MEQFRDIVRSGLRRGFAAFPGQDRLTMAWIVACGPALAERATVIGYDRSGMVSVEVRDRAWLNEIEGMRDYLKVELARIAGVKVAELHFIVKR